MLSRQRSNGYSLTTIRARAATIEPSLDTFTMESMATRQPQRFLALDKQLILANGTFFVILFNYYYIKDKSTALLDDDGVTLLLLHTTCRGRRKFFRTTAWDKIKLGLEHDVSW